MNTYIFQNLNSRNLNRTWIYGILIIASALAAYLAVQNIKLTHDSLTYGLVSQQILSGNGIQTPTIWLDSTAVPDNGTVPMILHAPLFPTLLALFGGITPHHYFAAQMLNFICYILIALFTFSLMKRLTGHDYIALLTGILVSVSSPLLTAVHHIWTETSFIAFIIATIYFISAARGDNYARHDRYFLLTGISASAATLTRHAGLAILPVIYWEALMLIKDRRPEIKNKSTIIAVLLPTIAPLIYYAYIYKITGRIQGYVNFQVENSFISAFQGAISMTFEQFQLGPASTIVILIFITLFIVYVCFNSHARREFSKILRKGLDITIIYTISHFALITMAMTKRAPVYELRFMSPLVPFLVILCVFSIIFIWDIIKLRGYYKLYMGGIILSLGILALGIFYKTSLYIPEFQYKQKKLYEFTDSCTYKWLIDNYDKNTIITTNWAHYISFFGGYSTAVLPNRRYIKRSNIPEDMESFLPDRMSEIGSNALVLINAKEKDLGSYIAGLFNTRQHNKNFTLAYECSDGVVYDLKKQVKL